MANASKYSIFGLVIDAPKESPQILEDLRAYEALLHECKSFYFLATIIHDKDFNSDGLAKTTHLHAFVNFGVGTEYTLKQGLELFAKILSVNAEQISIEGSNSDILLCQYLTHQNHPEKAQYSTDLIRTSNREKLSQLIEAKYTKPKNEDEEILDAIKASNSLLALSEKIGISSANRFRSTYNQIKAESKTDIEGMSRRLRETEIDNNKLFNMLLKIVREIEAKALTQEDLDEANALLDVLDFYKRLE